VTLVVTAEGGGRERIASCLPSMVHIIQD